ncbi:DNA primase [Metamycoplasma phocicerebrale]|uniref:DNA primase n=1 Tax=Metamycoplasma phocicerebrale TaxID=142649 RepID=A0A3T0TU38_9BACT|nr:DNA primase [Metamycoplasma phocicerebrale]AZZ65533.1 DNA primase [Metamycoplasma phocicerebrale]
MIKENVWEYVISNADIVNIIGEYVALEKQGKNYKACCPFHGEKTPSFVVNKEKGIFRCFGCGKGGNVIKFIEYRENLSSIEALKFLAKKLNLDISSFGKYLNKSNVSSEHTKLFELNSAALDFFKYQITFEKTKELEAFLIKRDLTKDIIKEFEIGYAASEKIIYNKLKELNFDTFSIFNSSLISSYENKNFFNDRLIFPIHDKFGNVVAFSGRDITNNSDPKYLNSAETLVFKKNEVMFNYFHAKEEISKTNEVYLVEGQFDCIALYKCQIKNAVAIMGTSLSPIHLKELSNKTINLFFDNDKAGINATLKNLKMILYYANKYNLNVNIIKNNLNKDPDELYKLDNGKTLLNTINNKMDIVEYLYNKFKNVHNSKASEAIKFENYKILFEYIYYVNKQLTLTLQKKLNDNNILNENIFNSYLADFSKPNFPSDKSFASKVKEQRKNEINENSHLEEQNNFFIDNNQIIIDNISSKNLTSYQQENTKNSYSNKNKINILKKQLSPHWILLNDILLATLSQPEFAKQFQNEQFHSLTFDDNIQPTRELISYVVKKNKEGKKVGINNILDSLKEDINKEKEPLLKKKFEQYFEEAQLIKEMTIRNDSILELKKYNQKIKELVDQKNNHSPKELITKKGKE